MSCPAPYRAGRSKSYGPVHNGETTRIILLEVLDAGDENPRIGGMDAFARGLLIADSILADPKMHSLRLGRYGSFDSGDGERFENRELDLPALRDIAAAAGEPARISGKQELVENLINDHIVRASR